MTPSPKQKVIPSGLSARSERRERESFSRKKAVSTGSLTVGTRHPWARRFTLLTRAGVVALAVGLPALTFHVGQVRERQRMERQSELERQRTDALIAGYRSELAAKGVPHPAADYWARQVHYSQSHAFDRRDSDLYLNVDDAVQLHDLLDRHTRPQNSYDMKTGRHPAGIFSTLATAFSAGSWHDEPSFWAIDRKDIEGAHHYLTHNWDSWINAGHYGILQDMLDHHDKYRPLMRKLAGLTLYQPHVLDPNVHIQEWKTEK